MSSWMKSVDSFQKFRSDVQVKTTAGAIVSSVAIVTMIVLFFNELSIFLSIEKTNHLTVDSTRGEKLRINLNMEFQHISCSMLTLDVMDLAGSHQEDVDHTIHKTRLDKNGKIIGVALKDGIIVYYHLYLYINRNWQYSKNENKRNRISFKTAAYSISWILWCLLWRWYYVWIFIFSLL